MSRNRKTNRRSRTFQIESLDRRQMLSATGWSAKITTDRETDAPSPIAYVAKVDTAGNLIQKPIDNVLATSALIAPPPTPGTLDSEFGEGGKLTKHFFTVEDYAKAVAIQGNGPDAKLIVVGQIGDDVGIARFDADGDLDMTFGDWDVQRQKYMGFTKLNFSGYHESGFGVAIDQETGRIFIAATINSGNEAAVICLTRDGKLDHGFGEQVNGGRKGYRTIDFGGGTDQAFDLAIDSQKRIVVVGSADALKAGVARLTANGDLDLSFGYGGQRTGPFGGGGGRQYATAVAIDSSDRIFVVGRAHTNGYGVMRISSDGKIVHSSAINFGNGTEATDVAIDGEGRVVVVGTLWNGRGFGIARMSPHFDLDESFSLRNGEPTGGKVEIDWAGSDGARSVAIDPVDNGIYVVGRARSNGFGVVRLTDKGQLDRSFSPYGSDPGSGQAIVPFGGGAEAWGVTLDHERRVVVVGNDNYGDFAMARLHGTPGDDPFVIPMPSATPWRHPTVPADVNNDGIVSPLDALLVINELNQHSISDPATGRLPLPTTASYAFIDVSGDNFISPLDALLVINSLLSPSNTMILHRTPTSLELVGTDSKANPHNGPQHLDSDPVSEGLPAAPLYGITIPHAKSNEGTRHKSGCADQATSKATTNHSALLSPLSAGESNQCRAELTDLEKMT